jgi:two-component system, OmpR family, response regulator
MAVIAMAIGNANLRAVLVSQLQQQGHQVQHGASAVAARSHILELRSELIVVDYDLADGTGLELCQWLQESGNPAPILMLSTRLEEATITAALAYVDDYLKKPFGMGEFLARVAALLRRSHSLPSEITQGHLRIDLVRRRVFDKEEAIDLTPQEFSLLYVLLQSGGQPVDRAELMRRAWDEHMGNSRTVDNHILSLRKKLKQSDLIQTVRQCGYRLQVDPRGDGRLQ